MGHVPRRRLLVIPNPNSAVVWCYDTHDQNGDGTIEFEETMHRALGSPCVMHGRNIRFLFCK